MLWSEVSLPFMLMDDAGKINKWRRTLANALALKHIVKLKKTQDSQGGWRSKLNNNNNSAVNYTIVKLIIFPLQHILKCLALLTQ